jgi:hypothetical protein
LVKQYWEELSFDLKRETLSSSGGGGSGSRRGRCKCTTEYKKQLKRGVCFISIVYIPIIIIIIIIIITITWILFMLCFLVPLLLII